MAVENITKLMEELTGVPPKPPPRRLTKGERKERAELLRQFMELPTPLQRGCLKYASEMRKGYQLKEG